MQLVNVNQDDKGIRIDRWFHRHYRNVPFSLIAKLLRKGRVKINGKKAKMAVRINAGDVLTFPDIKDEAISHLPSLPSSLVKQLQECVIFKDEDIIVLNKPAGLAVQGGSKIKFSIDYLAGCLKYDYTEKPKLVHRLDKDTSGILVLARRTAIAAQLGEAFQKRAMDKTYLALVHGLPHPVFGKIDKPVEEKLHYKITSPQAKTKHAVTQYRVLDNVGGKVSLIELNLITGRTHQLRSHMASVGCPIIGDEKYHLPENSGFQADNMLLHAYKLSLELNSNKFSFHAPLPKYFTEAMDFLGLNL